MQSTNDVLRNELEKKYPDLNLFFGLCFNPFWVDKHETIDGAVQDFIQRTDLDFLNQILNDLQNFIKEYEFSDEKHLLDLVYIGLSGNVYPPGSGLTYKQWLLNLQDTFRGSVK